MEFNLAGPVFGWCNPEVSALNMFATKDDPRWLSRMFFVWLSICGASLMN